MNKFSYIALALFIVISITLILLPKKAFEDRMKKDFDISGKGWKTFNKVAFYRVLIGASALITIVLMLIVKAII